MKKSVLTLGLASCFFSASLSGVYAFAVQSFHSDINIHRDSSYTVKETIEVDFRNEQKRGIIRDIPVRTRDRYNQRRSLRVHVKGVTNGLGGRWDYKVYREGDYLNIRIGNPDVYISGPQTYVITYTVANGTLFLDHHDELYWNVTGDDWPEGIGAASATVTLPENVPSGQLQAIGFVGGYGSIEQGRVAVLQNGASYQSPRQLGLREGMTVALGWPKGMVEAPSAGTRLLWFLQDNYFAFFPFIFLYGFMAAYQKLGKDPDIGLSEAVRYEPPDQLRPGEIGTLVDLKADTVDITSSIIDLAARGYLTIEEQPRSFLGGKGYTFTKVEGAGADDYRGGLNDYETRLMNGLFLKGTTVSMDDLENSFYTTARTIAINLYDSLMKRNYFTAHPETIRNTYAGIGGTVTVLGIFTTIVSLSEGGALMGIPFPPLAGVSIAFCGIITLAFAPLMPKRTAIGRRAYIELKGFEEYLRRAEIEDLEYQEKRGLFEKFLPYAIAFGVSHQWARAFSDVYQEPPNWYRSSSWDSRDFSIYHFSNSLDSACNRMGRALTSTPRSASGGGSAFGGGGGGGFSGGGFGGGGGRSW